MGAGRARRGLRQAVVQLAAQAGYVTATSSAVALLADAAEHYLEQLCARCCTSTTCIFTTCTSTTCTSTTCTSTTCTSTSTIITISTTCRLRRALDYSLELAPGGSNGWSDVLEKVLVEVEVGGSGGGGVLGLGEYYEEVVVGGQARATQQCRDREARWGIRIALDFSLALSFCHFICLSR